MVHKSAKLLVYLLRPATAQGGGHGLSMLARVLNAVESYLHPSNGGYWTRRLSQLLASLCEYFTERVSAERLLPASDPSRLTEADVDKFAELILPLAMQGLYSKSGTATLQSCVALKYLGTLAPSIALPPLLVRVYQALTTLIEVHQTSSALEAMAASRGWLVGADMGLGGVAASARGVASCFPARSGMMATHQVSKDTTSMTIHHYEITFRVCILSHQPLHLENA